jgi:hypothetical protein
MAAQLVASRVVLSSTELVSYIYIITYARFGSVTNNSTRVRIGYRIYSLWRLKLQQITVTENILTPALVASVTHCEH